MLILLWILLALCALVLAFLAWICLIGHVQFIMRSMPHMELLIKSWGQWLDDGARIVVQHRETGAKAEFRKRRYKTRPDVLVFRYRNADTTRQFFSQVRSRFDAERISYTLELTRKQKRPRAIAVELDPTDVFTPVAAVRLLGVAFAPAPLPLHVCCEGRMRKYPDAPSVHPIPWTGAQVAGFHLGRRIRTLWLRLGA